MSNTIRMAIIQMDYNLAAMVGLNYLEEAANLAVDDGKGITSLRLAKEHAARIRDFRHETAKSYSKVLSARIENILKRLQEKNVNLTVFPEYSLPLDTLPVIQSFALAGMNIVAGSHTVLSGHVDDYKAIGLDIEETDNGKSVCPIFFSDGRVKHIEKLTRSKWETRMQLGNSWGLQELSMEGKTYYFGIFLCIDFIQDKDKNRNDFITDEEFLKADFLVVPSYTPVIRDFRDNAWASITRYYKPVLYVNASAEGGSEIFCHIKKEEFLTSQDGSFYLPAGDEAAVIVDLNIDEQFTRKPTSFNDYEPSKQVSILPFVYEGFSSDYFDFSEQYWQATTSRKRQLLRMLEEKLYHVVEDINTPKSLRDKLQELIHRAPDLDITEADFLVEALEFTQDISTIQEWRFERLYDATLLLTDIALQCSPEDLDEITEVLKYYKRIQDRDVSFMRPKSRVKYYRGVDPYILTVEPRPEDELVPSYFVFRLATQSSNPKAIEKQLTFLSTICNPGNSYLSLQLRYISYPVASPLRRQVQTVLIGRITHPERQESKKIARDFALDFYHLLTVALGDDYKFEVIPFDGEEEFQRYFNPFPINFVTEIRRPQVSDIESGDRATYHYRHFNGNSSMILIAEMLQRQENACMLSVHLQPISFSHHGFNTSEYTISDTTAVDSLSLTTIGLPTCYLRIHITSEQPLSPIVLNLVGTEIAGSNNFEIYEPLTDKDRQQISEDIRSLSFTVPVAPNPELQLDRILHLFETQEAIRAFRFPIGGFSGSVPLLSRFLTAPVAILPKEGIRMGIGAHSAVPAPIPIYLQKIDRYQHMYIVGKTGTGKSTLMANMIEQDIRNGEGVGVIDPHGDLVEYVLSRVPEERSKDVILFDPSDAQRPLGLNMLEINPEIPHHKHYIVQEIIAILQKLFYFEFMGPVFEHNIRYAMLSIMDNPDDPGTLIEVPRLIFDKNFRKLKIEKLKDQEVKDFWVKQFNSLADFHKSEQLFYVISKFDRFISDPLVRNIIGQPKSSFNVERIMDQGKILLVKVSKGVIGEINSALLAMILLSKFQWAGMRRATKPEKERRDFFLYIDEFQNFAATGFEAILSEARKYHLALILANQHIGQLTAHHIYTGRIEDRMQQAIFGNVGTILAFRVGISDSDVISQHLGINIPELLVNQKNFHALVKLMVNGEVQSAFSLRTELSDTKPDSKIAEIIRQNSRKEYGRDAKSVEDEISKRVWTPAVEDRLHFPDFLESSGSDKVG